MRVVRNPELIWDGQQQRVGFRDGLVFPELFDENLGLGRVAAPENRPRIFVEEADFVFLRASPKIAAIAVIKQRENTSADGNSRSALVTSFLPGVAKGANLRGLLNMQRLAALVEFQ